MRISSLRKKAIPYYACYLAHKIEDRNSITLESARISSWTQASPFRESRFRLEDEAALQAAAEYLADFGLVRFLPDEFGPDIIVRNDKFHEIRESLRRDEDSVFYKSIMAGESEDGWIAAALDSINEKLREDVTEVEEEDTSDLSEDSWEPLVIERENADFQDALEASEKALEIIEQNNGYATSDPEERNGIVNTIRGALEALKHGTTSRGAIIEGILKPFKYITRKFSDSVMGEFAKVAVAALIKWLF